MIPTPLKKQQHQLLVALVLEVALFIGLSLGLWYVWSHLFTLRQQVFEQQQAVSLAPENAMKQAELQIEYDKYRHDISRIHMLLIEQESIADFITLLETESKRHGITVRIPDIREEIKYDESNQPIPQTGPVIDVRLTVEAQGAPVKLLSFLHTVEHLPYVLSVIAFELTATDPRTVSYLSAQIPIPTTPAPDEPATPEVNATLKATIILTMSKDQ